MSAPWWHPESSPLADIRQAMREAGAEGKPSDPVPYCLVCDEPLTWCLHGDGSAWSVERRDSDDSSSGVSEGPGPSDAA